MEPARRVTRPTAMCGCMVCKSCRERESQRRYRARKRGEIIPHLVGGNPAACSCGECERCRMNASSRRSKARARGEDVPFMPLGRRLMIGPKPSYGRPNRGQPRAPRIDRRSPELRASWNHARRLRIAGNPPCSPECHPATPGEIRAWLGLRAESACALCGSQAEHVDHVVPLYSEGCGCVANLRWLCAPCNLRRKRAGGDDDE